MDITVRPASLEDLQELIRLYRSLEDEMVPLSDMWQVADGLPEPIDDSFGKLIEDDDAFVYLGSIDGVTVGFTVAVVENVLPQGEPMRVGSFRLIFVDHDAREVGVGEAIRDAVMDMLRTRQITRFDAHVLPGHRLVKNFFESGGFSARSIVMHHDAGR